jgi:hypothetical protein
MLYELNNLKPENLSTINKKCGVCNKKSGKATPFAPDLYIKSDLKSREIFNLI